MSRVLAIDPGTEKSAFVVLPGPDEPFAISAKGLLPNDILLQALYRPLVSEQHGDLSMLSSLCDHLAIEMIASYGMAVGQSTFMTVFWIGRFWEAASDCPHRTQLYRKKDIAMHLCHSMRAKDSNIRQALIDRYGKPGTKAEPGVLYGVSTHIWAALAVGVTYRDRMEKK